MAERINERPKGVNWNSGWPYSTLPKAAKSKGDWTLAISINPGAVGLVAYYPTSEEPPELRLNDGSLCGLEVAFRPFYRVDLDSRADKFCITFCSRGHFKAPALAHQDGIMWGFNWAVPTLATVRMASQIADKYFGDDYDGAWNLGRAFGTQIREAENAAYEASRVAAWKA